MTTFEWASLGRLLCYYLFLFILFDFHSATVYTVAKVKELASQVHDRSDDVIIRLRCFPSLVIDRSPKAWPPPLPPTHVTIYAQFLFFVEKKKQNIKRRPTGCFLSRTEALWKKTQTANIYVAFSIRRILDECTLRLWIGDHTILFFFFFWIPEWMTGYPDEEKKNRF